MAEQFDLTASENVQSYSVLSLWLNWQKARIDVWIADEDGREYRHTYKGQEATDLMISLNKANLTSNSLQKRIMNQLATDGKINAGTVTGTPD